MDHRAIKVLGEYESGVEPKDYTSAMLSYRKFLAREQLTKEELIAFGIRDSKRQSEIIEALLLSSCPLEEIEEAFNVPRNSVEIYAELFYDTAVFMTDLDRMEYLEDYPDPAGRELKLEAVSLGYEFILFNFANLVPKTVAQKKLVERMFMATAYKAMSMNFNSIKSDVTKQAVRHAELMIKAYELLNKINADDGQDTYDLVTLLVKEDVASSTMRPSGEEII